MKSGKSTMGKRSRACEFSAAERRKIHTRDHETCIFCRLGYRPSPEAGGALQIMHYLGRGSKGGLGIEQNGALGCVYHHQMMDNGFYHDEMHTLFREYLKSCYPEWDEESLKYDKWRWIEEVKHGRG